MEALIFVALMVVVCIPHSMGRMWEDFGKEFEEALKKRWEY